MAGKETAPSFPAASADDPPWNPALLPNHESPSKPASDSVEVEHWATAMERMRDGDGLPVTSGPVQAVLLSASQAHTMDRLPASDDDCFDRYGRLNVAPIAVVEAPRSLEHAADGGAPWNSEAGAISVHSTRQEPIQAIDDQLELEEPKLQIERASTPAKYRLQPLEDMYEHQGEDSDLEDAIQHSAKELLLQDQALDWQTRAQETLADVGAFENDALKVDADQRDTAGPAVEEPQQPDANVAVLSVNEAILPSQDACLSVDITRPANPVPVEKSTETDLEQEPIAVPSAEQESSQDEWGTTANDAFNFDTAPQDQCLADITAAAEPGLKGFSVEELEHSWAAVADDDDFLPEDAAAAFSFDVDDADGSLEDKNAGPTAAKPSPQTRHARSTSTLKYTPANIPQSGLPPPTRTVPYRSEAPSFVNLSKSQQLLVPTQRIPAASSHVSAYQLPAQRPTTSSAESFADKAKSGYHSPYDLPDDLAIKRRRPAAHVHASTPAVTQGTHPVRLNSMQSISALNLSTMLGAPAASSVAPQLHTGTASTAAQAMKSSNRNDGFFIDHPVTSRLPRQATPSQSYRPQPTAQAVLSPLGPPAPIRAASTSYTLHQPSMEQQYSSYNVGIAELQPAERMPLYSDGQAQQQSSTTPQPMPSRYSPAVPSISTTTYSPAPPAFTPDDSRYSPVNGANQAPNAVDHKSSDVSNGLSRASVLYAPRISSPLAHHTAQNHERSSATPPQTDIHPPGLTKMALHRTVSVASLSEFQTANENAESTPSPPYQPDAPQHALPTSNRKSTSPPRRTQPSMGMTSPRKRANYAPSNYQPAVAGSIRTVIPSKRAQTSSPSTSINLPNATTPGHDRPVSVTALRDSSQAVFFKQPNRILSSAFSGPAYHEIDNLIQPHDGSAHDPLQRWKAAPIFNWGNGSIIATTFPRYTPTYGTGSAGHMIKPSPGEIKVGPLNTISTHSDIFLKFPGPLKKGKKKEVIAWLKSSGDQLQAEHQSASMNGELTAAMHTRSEERILLWRIMTLLVEHDGTLEGNPTVVTAVRKLITPSTPDPVSAIDETDPSRSNVQAEAVEPLAVKTMRSYLYAGEREKAVWHAVDQRLWAHALLIASTLNDKEIWKQVVQEFVRKEVRKIGENTEALAALYQVFAGNWEESIDELVSVSARSGFQMVSTISDGTPQKDALAGLDKWRETLLLVLNNRSAGDVAALSSLGNLLNGYGRVEAGHICFLFARAGAKLGAADDQQSSFTLVGGHSSSQGSDFGQSLDTILLSEVYEFAMVSSDVPTIPIAHLQPYKLYHAEVLAEAGRHTEARQYSDTITSIVAAKANRSPYYNQHFLRWLDDFAKRVSQAPADKSDSSWKPSIDRVSSSIWGKFNDFITGESNPAEITAPARGVPESFATMPMRKVLQTSTQTQPRDRAMSGSGMSDSCQLNGWPVSAPLTSTNFQSAPYAVAYTPSFPLEQERPRHRPLSRSTHESRAYIESSKGASPQATSPPRSLHSTSLQIAPRGDRGLHTPPQCDAEGMSLNLGSLYAPSTLEPITSEYSVQSSVLLPTSPSDQFHETNGLDTALLNKPIINLDGRPQRPACQSESSDYSYEPLTTSYQPASYQTYQPDEGRVTSEADVDTNPIRKKSFLDDDDDDDDIVARAATLKKNQPSEADGQFDEVCRKTAETDAAKAAAAKTGTGAHGSWFGGWFGKKQDLNAPVVHKAKLGEESSFYFDKDLGRWVNRKGSADAATPATATPPPPKSIGLPLRPSSSMMTPPPMPSPTKSVSPFSVTNRPPISSQGPLQRSANAQPPAAGPIAALVGGPPSRPPSRPSTSMSNASDIDDLLGPAASRKAGAKKANGRKGRYFDVLASKS